jgi:hypothetical protein
MRAVLGVGLFFAVIGMWPVAAGAHASATPSAGMYRTVGGGESGGFFTVKAGGKSIALGGTAQSNFKCNKMNAMVTKAIPIANGAFAFTGPSKMEPNVTITWTGKWTSPTSVSGTVRLKSGSCDSGAIAWKAKLTMAAMAVG